MPKTMNVTVPLIEENKPQYPSNQTNLEGTYPTGSNHTNELIPVNHGNTTLPRNNGTMEECDARPKFIFTPVPFDRRDGCFLLGGQHIRVDVVISCTTYRVDAPKKHSEVPRKQIHFDYERLGWKPGAPFEAMQCGNLSPNEAGVSCALPKSQSNDASAYRTRPVRLL